MKNFTKIFTKKLGLIYGTVGFGLLFPAIAFAGNNKLMNGIAEFFFRFFLWPFIGILRLELWILPVIASYNDFTREAGVIVGWTLVRDLTNTFFILILLVIAFATILRISSYGYKQLLSKLLIVAILVNFSMTIVGLAIDLSQVVMMTFLRVIKDIMAGNIMVGLGLESAFSMSENYTDVLDPGDYIASLVIAGIMLAITTVILGAFIAMLTMRVITLWITIILSPAAFVAFIFPSAKKYYSQWSTELGKNLVTGPALLFFLWLTFTIITANENMGASMGSFASDELESPSKILGTGNVIKYVIGTALLMGGLKFAAGSGAAGAGAMSWGANKINSTASSMGKRYVGGAVSRMGATAAGAFVDSEGNSRGLGKALNKTPFWGGRLQRGAIKMQGYDAHRIKQQAAEDQKYVSAEKQVAFQGTQSRAYMSGLGEQHYETNKDGSFKKDDDGNKIEKDTFGSRLAKKKGGGAILAAMRGAGRATSYMTSGAGGIGDAQVIKAQNMVATGVVPKGGAGEKEVYDALRRVDDQDSIDRMQADGYTQNMSERDAANMVDKFGVGMISKIKEESFRNADGSEAAGTKRYFDALIANTNIDAHAINNEMIKRGASKFNRRTATDQMSDDLESGKFNNSLYMRGEDGKIVFDQTGNAEVDANGEFMKRLLVVMTTYPDRAAAMMAEASAENNHAIMSGGEDLGKSSVDIIPRRHNESDPKFEKRGDEIRKKDNDLEKEAEDIGEAEGKDSAAYKAKQDEIQKHRRKARGLIDVKQATKEITRVSFSRQTASEEHARGEITDDELEKRNEHLDDKQAGIYASTALNLDGSSPEFERIMGQFFIKRENPSQDDLLAEHGYDKNSDKYKVDHEKARAKAEGAVKDSDIAAEVGSRGTETDEQWIKKEEKARRVLVTKKQEEIEKRETVVKALSKEEDKKDAEKKLTDSGEESSATALARKLGEMTTAFTAINNEGDGKKLADIRVEMSGKDKTDPAYMSLQKQELALIRKMTFAKREAVGGHANLKTDVGSGAIVRAAQDGMNYERLFEMDITDATQRDMFMNFSIQANQDQQKQLLSAGTPQQIKLFAESLARSGSKVSKPIMDNLDPTVQLDIYQMMAQVKFTKEGMTRAAAKISAAAMDIGELKKQLR